MTSLIETFIYEWVGDSSKLEKAEKGVEKTLDEATQSMRQQDDASQKLGASLRELVTRAAAVVEAWVGFSALKGIAESAAESTIELANQARELRVNADELDTWRRAIAASGGDVGGLAGTIKTLSERTRDPLGALERVADRFKGLSDYKADKLAEALGIDAGSAALMRNGRAGLVELVRQQQALGEVTQAQIEAAQEWQGAQKNLNFVLDDTKRGVMMQVLPALTEFLRMGTRLVLWMRENSTFTVTFFAAIAAVITARLLPALIRVGVAALPWIALAAAVAAVGGAVALVIDDIRAFEQGANSMIGVLAQRWPMLGTAVKHVADFFYILRDIAGAVMGLLKDGITAPEKAWERFGQRMDGIMASVQAYSPALATAFKVIGLAGELAFKAILVPLRAVLWAMGQLGKGAGWVMDKLGMGASEDKGEQRYKSPAEVGQKVLQQAQGTGLASMSSAAISNSKNVQANKTTTVQTGPITVQTQATDAQGIAGALGKGLQQELRGAIDEFDDGVMM